MFLSKVGEIWFNNLFYAKNFFVSKALVKRHIIDHQCDQIWQNFKSLWVIFWTSYLVLGKLLHQVLHFLILGKFSWLYLHKD